MGADCAWVIFCVENGATAFTRRYLVIASMAAVSRERECVEVVGGLRHGRASLRYTRHQSYDCRPFAKVWRPSGRIEMRSQKYPSF